MCCWIPEHFSSSVENNKLFSIYKPVSSFLHNINQRTDFWYIKYKSDIFRIMFLSKIKVIFTHIFPNT